MIFYCNLKILGASGSSHSGRYPSVCFRSLWSQLQCRLCWACVLLCLCLEEYYKTLTLPLAHPECSQSRLVVNEQCLEKCFCVCPECPAPTWCFFQCFLSCVCAFSHLSPLSGSFSGLFPSLHFLLIFSPLTRSHNESHFLEHLVLCLVPSVALTVWLSRSRGSRCLC